MFSSGGSIVVNRPVEAVHRFLADTGRDTDWRRPYVRSSRQISSGPLEVGATYETIYRILGVRSRTVVEITEHDPPMVLAWRQLSKGLGVTLDGRYVLEAHNGLTRVNIRQIAKAQGPARLVEPLLALYINRVARRMLRQLKDAVE